LTHVGERGASVSKFPVQHEEPIVESPVEIGRLEVPMDKNRGSPDAAESRRPRFESLGQPLAKSDGHTNTVDELRPSVVHECRDEVRKRMLDAQTGVEMARRCEGHVVNLGERAPNGGAVLSSTEHPNAGNELENQEVGAQLQDLRYPEGLPSVRE
jgi:hypothetical protein